MRRPLFCLLLTAAVASLPCLRDARAQAAKEKSAKDKSAPVLPHYDPPDQPFRMAPMPQSTRSIVVPLATNLHLAFDTALLRTHTVWSGKGLALLGPQYGLPKSPFISTNDGTVLWTMPPVFPWAVGKLPEQDEFKPPSNWSFAGLEVRRGEVSMQMRVLHPVVPPEFGGGSVSESFSWSPESTTGVIRSFSIGSRIGKELWFLAHAETGHAEVVSETAHAALIQRSNDVLVVSVPWRQNDTALLKLVAVDKLVDYEVETVTEGGAEKGHPKRRVVGTQGRVYVQSTSRSDGSHGFTLQTEVFPNRAEAMKWIVSRQGPRSVKERELKWKEESERYLVWEAAKTAAGPKPILRLPAPTTHSEISQSAKPSQVSTPAFRAEAFPLPKEANLLVTGMDFLPNGDLALCTWAGEVWMVEGAQGPPAAAKYRRFARGLAEPMGVAVRDGKIYVGTKQGLYRIEGTGEASGFECLNQSWGYTGSYNAFVYGPVFDKAGNFILASAGHSGRWDSAYMGWGSRISPDGAKLDAICSGFREPNGIGTFGPDRDVFVSENQGQWIAACKLNHVTPGKFYGHPSAWPAPQEEYGKHTRFDPPAVWFPYKLARSTTGLVEITDDRFGPFKGQLMVGDFQNAIVTRVQLEKVNGEYQGAVWPFLKQFQSGVNRLTYGPDGKLYVGGCQAPRSWTAVAPQEFALERVSYTGKLPFEVKEVHALRDGFELTFTQPVEVKAAADPESYDVTQYGYKYHAKYGSPEYDHDGKENAATVIKVAAATVLPDKLKVRLKLEGWKAGYVTMVRSLDVKNAAGESLVNDTFWYTLNQLPDSR